MKNFYVMIGNIGSGKSTYIKKHLQDGVVISKDGIRYTIGGGEYIFNPKYEPLIHATTMAMTRIFCGEYIPNIILDETNVQRKGRKQFINLAKSYGYKVIAVVMPKLDKKTSVDRRMTNPHCQPNREVWEEVWTKFDNKYSEPSVEEGFDEIIEVDIKEVI